MTTSVVSILVYAAIMLAGGAVGYALSGSKPSLIAGGSSAILLAGAFAIARRGSSPAAGLWIAAALALLLTVVFVMRFQATGKFMPAGMMMIVSLLFAGYFAYSARE